MPGPTRPAAVRLRRAAPWLALALAVAATAALVAVRGEELGALADLAPAAVAWLVLHQLAYLVAQSGRFHVVLVRFADRPVGFAPWLRLFVLGRFLNLFVPQGGNVYRAVELHGEVPRRAVTLVPPPWTSVSVPRREPSRVMTTAYPCPRALSDPPRPPP